MDLNLDTLKREIVDQLEDSEFAVFHSYPDTLESPQTVLWDVKRFPDYQMFLEVARKSGATMILLAAGEMSSGDLDELAEQLEECDLEREELREYQTRLRKLRAYVGATCSLEIAFDHGSRFYVYRARPDWYEEFLELEDDILERFSEGDLDDDEESLGGYFSNN